MINFFSVHRTVHPHQPPSFQVSKVENEIASLESVRDHFEERFSITTPTFWQTRLMTVMLTSPHIFSMARLPQRWDYGITETIFIQKDVAGQEAIGYIAPDLSEEERNELDSIAYHITDEESWRRSLEGIDENILEEIALCLACFLNDPSTKTLALSYQEPGQAYTTRCWTKDNNTGSHQSLLKMDEISVVSSAMG